jgi:hypothetical protein
MVTLDNGASCTAPSTAKLSTFKVGEKVTVDYTTTNGNTQINTIKPCDMILREGVQDAAGRWRKPAAL